MRTVYVNGEYLPESEAKISVFDRGFLFADAVYEVTTIVGGELISFDGHLKRLRRSLDELEMPSPADDNAILAIHLELIERNNLDQGLIYIQISRGVADRDFYFPSAETPATFVAFSQRKKIVDYKKLEEGIKIISAEDRRWGRRDIKTVQLLYPSMVKMQAKAQGAADAWLVEDGYVTEGTSNNACIVTADGTIVTRHLNEDILHGITRAAILSCAESMQIPYEERAFTIEEAKNAREAFVTSATCVAVPVTSIDGTTIGNGNRGPLTARLQEAYIQTHMQSVD